MGVAKDLAESFVRGMFFFLFFCFFMFVFLQYYCSYVIVCLFMLACLCVLFFYCCVFFHVCFSFFPYFTSSFLFHVSGKFKVDNPLSFWANGFGETLGLGQKRTRMSVVYLDGTNVF